MRKVIIDCDPGIDDTLALSLAVKSPDIEVVAITVVCGNVPADIGTQNVLKCLERCDRLDIPVYQGMETFEATFHQCTRHSWYGWFRGNKFPDDLEKTGRTSPCR